MAESYGAYQISALLYALHFSDTQDSSPWHGACFNVCTGDIEDAPAPAALHSFKAHVEDGKIYVTAAPEATLSKNKSRPPKLSAQGSQPGAGKGVVIVGGGSGALHCVESLREVSSLIPSYMRATW